MSITLEGYLKATTDRAVLFQGMYWEAAEWLPRSQITITKDAGLAVVLTVKPWIAGKNNIREFTYREAPAEQENENNGR